MHKLNKYCIVILLNTTIYLTRLSPIVYITQLLSFNNLSSVWTYTNHNYRTLAKLLKPFNIFPTAFRQFLKCSATRNINIKALCFLINRLATIKLLKCSREILNNCTIWLFISTQIFSVSKPISVSSLLIASPSIH